MTRQGSNFIVLLLFSWHHCHQLWIDHDFLFHCLFFLSFFSYNLLCQQSPIPSICHFFHSSPSLSRSLLMQCPSQVRSSSSPPFPFHFQGKFFISHFFPHVLLTNFFLELSFTSTNLHSHFIHFLLPALWTPMINLTRLFFANLNLC